MLAKGMQYVIRIISEFSIGIIRGPLSFGIFSSIKAGKKIMRISMGLL
jgi:hypothetical protein